MRSIHRPRSAQRDDFPNPLFRAMATHPLGVVAGAVIGAAAGFLVVSLFAGATATLVGAVIGLLAGATIAAGIAERSDRSHRSDDASRHDAGDRYFAERFEQADYRRHDATFEDYRPAYRYGCMRARSAVQSSGTMRSNANWRANGTCIAATRSSIGTRRGPAYTRPSTRNSTPTRR